MAKESIINTRLEDLIEVIDMRAFLSIFLKGSGNAGEILIKSDKVCYIACNGEFMSVYGSYKVVGMAVTLGKISILIQSEEA